MRKSCFILVLLLSLFILFPGLVWAAVPSISGKSVVLIDTRTGQVLFEKEKDEKLSPASTTKILTAIIAIESGRLDDTVTIGHNPPCVEGTRVYLKEGEKISLRELVQASLIHSANDAALAIAEYMAGSTEEFAVMMNTKAKEIGAVNSNFINPHGLSEDEHYSTAYDLCLIGQYCMNNETFREIVKTKVLDWEGQEWQTRLININKLLWDYEGANGVKTGYTTESKNTIVASAEKENRSYIAVVLGSSGNAIWDDAEKLLDYAFQQFQLLELVNSSEVVATVNINEKTRLQLVPKNSFSLSLPRGEGSKVESQVILTSWNNSIKKGQIAGQMVFYLDGAEAGRVDLLANNNISTFKITTVLIYMGAGLFFLQVVFRAYLMYKRKKRNNFRWGHSYRSY